MSSVEWTSATEVMTGSPSGNGRGRWWLRRLPARLAQWLSGLSDLRARRVAAGLLVVAFVLLVVSQWKPWFRMEEAGGIALRGLPSEASDIDAITALYLLVVPYFVCWTVIAMSCGAAVFGRKRMRRAAAGVAGGALAAQALILLTAWHSRGIGEYSLVISSLDTLHTSRQSGIYLAFAALLVTAAALAIVLRGRIFPMGDDDDDDGAAMRATTPATSAGSMGAAAFGAGRTGAGGDEDEPHTPAPRMGVRAGAPWVGGGEALDDPGADPDGYGYSRHESAYLNGHQPMDRGVAPAESQNPPHRAETPDHSMYMRPRSTPSHTSLNPDPSTATHSWETSSPAPTARSCATSTPPHTAPANGT